MTHIEIVEDLRKFYNKKMADEQMDFYMSEIRNVDTKLLELAAGECKRTERIFPTVKTLQIFISRVRHHQTSTTPVWRSPEEQDREEWRRAEPEYFKEAIRLMRFASKKHKTPAERGLLVEQCRMMDAVWPGYGWDKTAATLRADYIKRGLLEGK